MKNIKLFAFLAIFLLSAAVSSAWAWKGSGTSDAPYQITSAADLTQLATDVNGGESYSNMYFKQTADITLSGEWTPIGTQSNPFKGHYDGGGFAIRGLRVTGNYKHAGLFGYISSDRYHGSQIFIELKNINIVDCVIDVGTVDGSAAGSIAGETGGPVSMTGNRVRGSITAYGYTGGLIGIIRSNANVSNNFVDVTVSGTGNQYNQYYHPDVCLMVSVSGGSSSGSGNYYHDNGGNVSVSLNTNITATPVYSVTVTAPVGLTDSDANVTLDGVKYYETGKTVTFGFSGSGSVVYFVNGERIEGNSVTVGKKDLKVEIGIPYIDENGKEQIRKPGEYTVLTEGNKPNKDGVIELPGGWYVVQGEVSYGNSVNFGGDAHLILADGAKLEIETKGESEHGIYASNNLTIYGQNEQWGILNATANGSGIFGNVGVTISGGTVTAAGDNGDGIYGSKGVTINGGIVTATSYYGYGIHGDEGNITISGGTVTVTGSIYGDGGFGIYSVFGDITINGGTVSATGKDYGIYNFSGDITLGWTNSTDFIYASSYSLGDNEKHVSIAEGRSFKDESGNVYRGTIDDVSDIAGKKLEPCYAVALDLQDGKAPVMLPAAFDENGVAHVTKPENPTRDGFTFEGWFTTKDGNTEFDFTKAVTENTAAYAKWKLLPVKYIDEDGATKSVTDIIVLTEDNKPNEDGVIELSGGWYVVQGKVKYSNQVKFSGDAHLILADGAEMEIETKGKLEHGIVALNNLTIYGQSKQNGTLNVTAFGYYGDGIYSKKNIMINGGSITATGDDNGIYSKNGSITISGGTVEATGGDGIYSNNGSITISGGTVEATGDYDGIFAASDITISGDTVTATGKENGINCLKGDMTINGGTVSATGKDYGIYGSNVTINGGSVTASGDRIGIYANSDIILSWTNSTDFIWASRYYGINGSVKIAEGKSLKDEKGNVYSGTLSSTQLDIIRKKPLKPYYAVTLKLQDGSAPVVVAVDFDENGIAHVAKPADPTRSGSSFLGWFTSADGDTEFDFTAAVTSNTTIYAKWEHLPVQYIDEDGATKSVTDFIVLTEDNKPNEDGVIELSGGWYVVQGEVSYKSIVEFGGDAHLILADGATMTIVSKTDGIQVDKNLTIYGQSKQKGTLKVTSTSTLGSETNQIYRAIYSFNGNITINGGTVEATGGDGISSLYGNITINGGSVTAFGYYADGIDGSKVTINGGSVTATGDYRGICSWKGNITISGGKVTATGDRIGIYAQNDIILSWTNSTDFIKASNYSLGDNEKHVSIAEGKSFKDEKGTVYSGTLSDDDLRAIQNNTLVPAKPFPDNMVIADIPDQIYTGDSICPMADVTMPAGVDPLVKGEDYKVVCKENLNAGTATLSVQGVGIYYGEIKKTFTIAKAPLTITAKDKTIAYGDEPANDGVEYDGFVGEENESVLGGKLTYSYDYKKIDKVGKYTITPSGLTAGNYEISFVAGALNVEPKATHYAAVQVLEDENGKRAEIDGEYGEGDGIVITEPLEVASVEFSRDFSTQGYSTIVLPFDVNTSKLSGVDSVLSFARIVKEQGEMAVGMKAVWEASTSHVDLKANTPYMVKMTGAKLGIDGGVTLLPTKAAVTKSDAQNDGWEFRGTYAYKSWQEGDEDLCRVYGFAGGSNDEVSEGDFVKFTAGASLRPLRAYLINTNRTCGAPKMARAYGDYVLGAKSSIDDLPESMKVVIVGEDGHTTVIGHFNTRTGEFTTGTSVRKFDLKGRAVRGTPSARGAYYGKRVKK